MLGIRLELTDDDIASGTEQLHTLGGLLANFEYANEIDLATLKILAQSREDRLIRVMLALAS